MLTVANSLLRSAGPLLNMCVVIGITWLIFGIVGVSLFRNRLDRCDVEDYYGIGMQDCLDAGEVWNTVGWNYDNIFEAMVTLFLLTTMENWPNVVGSVIDMGNSSTSGPIYNNKPWVWVYFILFIFISNFI